MFLRVLVAVTFIWSGLGKVLSSFQVQGADALTLYNLGVIEGPVAHAAPPAAPVNPPAAPTESRPLDPGAPADSPASEPGAALPGAATLVRYQPAPRPPRLAADFSAPVEVSEVYRTSLRLADASAPAAAPDGTTRPALLPAWMGSDPWAKVLAWTGAVSELLGGAFILLGLLTRFWALMLAGTMAMAIWLTEIGAPAIDGSGPLGFLPAGRPPFSEAAWGHLLWEFSLLCVCLSLLFSGAGSLSLDRGLFRGRREEDDE
jgi:uncharacterized membrane protein YphA (DoxX/SURF4 family)